MKPKICYRETQTFFTKWLTALLIVLWCVMLYRAYSNAEGMGVGIWILAAVTLLLCFSRLHLRIDQKGMSITFFPFAYNKRWEWEQLDEFYVKKYSLSDFGGWGFRIGKEGIAYTTRGQYGIQLKPRNKSSVLIGTQHPDKVREVLNQIKRPHDENIDQSI